MLGILVINAGRGFAQTEFVASQETNEGAAERLRNDLVATIQAYWKTVPLWRRLLWDQHPSVVRAEKAAPGKRVIDLCCYDRRQYREVCALIEAKVANTPDEAAELQAS